MAGQSPYQISGDKSAVEAALIKARAWMVPAETKTTLTLLGELFLKTAKPGSSDEDFRARLNVYARGLAKFPADISTDIVRKWRGKFFPTYDELMEACENDPRWRDRCVRIRALREHLEREETPPRPRIDPSRLDEIKRQVDDKWKREVK